jgi:DNA-binding response OmpR family regulator
LTQDDRQPRILVGDADCALAAQLVRDLGLEGFNACASHDGGDVLNRARAAPPDLLILDLDMPVKDGLALCGEIRASRSGRTTPIILTSMRSDDRTQIAGFDLGADDYVIKPYSRKVMLIRVRRLLTRRGWAGGASPPQELCSQGVVLDLRGHCASYLGRDLGLTPTELRLLHVLMSEPGRALGRDELIDRVVGRDHAVLEGTINAYVKDLRRKLGGGAYLIKTVRSVGYRFLSEPIVRWEQKRGCG